MAASPYLKDCVLCKRECVDKDVWVLKSYNDDGTFDAMYICKKCDEGDISQKREADVYLYIYQCFMCGCLMSENFFNHDDTLNMCFECLGIKSTDKIWQREDGTMVESYDAGIEFIDLNDEDPWVTQFNKLRAAANVRKERNACRNRQKKVMAYEKISDTFIRWLPDLDIVDARNVASSIDITRSPEPVMIADESEFLEWVLMLKKKKW